MFKDVEAVVLYESHSVLKCLVSVYVFVHVFPLPAVPGVSSHWLLYTQCSISRNASSAWAGRGDALEGQEPRVSVMQPRLMALQLICHCGSWHGAAIDQSLWLQWSTTVSSLFLWHPMGLTVHDPAAGGNFQVPLQTYSVDIFITWAHTQSG